ncbi:MAG TPA: clostripain-related cysteine peptidase [Deltaproteobacteria bacterium]|nr:clostripain-related cysteine peptidase [Deltaproteobacteria bacterium]
MRLRCFHTVVPVLLLITGAIVSSCGSSGSSGSESGSASWTYMIYMAADNSLSNFAENDINEMESVASYPEVNVVVQAEFKYIDPVTTPGIPDATVRGRVAHDGDLQAMGSWYTGLGDLDMADPDTLTEFITWAAGTYPADRYALVLWSHGMGWKNGAAEAATKGMITDGTSPAMPLGVLSRAVRASGVHFDVINFDTCLMGMYEVAYEFRDLASYLVFSEEEYPANGDPYHTILTHLRQDPSMDGLQLAGTITADCMAFYSLPNVDFTMTKSAVDTAVVDQLHAEMCDLAGYLIDHMDSAQKGTIEEARSEALAYDYPANLDLGDFLQKLRDRTEDAVLQAMIDGILQNTLPGLVVSNEVHQGTGDAANEGITSSRGIAIYLPSVINAGELLLYEGLECSQSPDGRTWSDFVLSFLTQA